MSRKGIAATGAIKDNARPMLSATVAKHTFARIDVIADVTGLSRGQIVDMAVDCLDLCDECDGSGRAVAKRAGEVLCPACYGHKVVPR